MNPSPKSTARTPCSSVVVWVLLGVSCGRYGLYADDQEEVADAESGTSVRDVAVDSTSDGHIDVAETADVSEGSDVTDAKGPGYWRMTSTVPSTIGGRVLATGVWTGTRAVFWGGYYYGPPYTSSRNDGAGYDPAGDSWMVLPVAPAQFSAGRFLHTAVFDGTRMILWGGLSGSSTVNDTGAIYDSKAMTWSISGSSGAPSARAGHVAVWSTTSGEMIVWGGCSKASMFSFPPTCSSFLDDGAAFQPSSGVWRKIAPAPVGFEPRWRASAVWTGSDLVVFGGEVASGSYAKSCARYDPKLDVWTKLTDPPLDARYDGALVFADKDLIAWGGRSTFVDPAWGRSDGARYRAGAWSLLATASPLTPAARYAFGWWLGAGKLHVWSGASLSSALPGGAAYDPVRDEWSAMPTSGEPSARVHPTVVWTGIEAIVYAGRNTLSTSDPSSYLADAAVYRP